MSYQSSSQPTRAECQSGLHAAIVEVAETSLFAFTDECDADGFADALQQGAAECFRGAVRFDGAFGGEVELMLPDALARELCASFGGLNSPDEVGERDLADFVGEVANMVCGAWLTRACHDQSFTLAPPQVTRGAAEPTAADACRFFLAINDTPASVRLFWASNPASRER